MVRLAATLLLCAACAAAAPTTTSLEQGGGLQHILDGSPILSSQPPPRKLRGRFLHLTDLHPDPFYTVHSDPLRECHSGKGHAGVFGAEVTECDTPISLVNATFKWIEENLKDEIDFVVWTGDSARHDNDEKIPRSDKQVLKLNRFVVNKFVEVFGKPDNLDDPDPTNDFVVPIVPTFGNNDILPHNIFEPGPNKWTRAYLDIWNRFVPQAQKHSFARGGWFFTEVIPNKLAVFSLNTLYFFDSNGAVDGCDKKSEPGYEHMEWLRIQLQFLRDRGMKAILIGHVPPARTDSKQNWDETCYQKYTLWMRQYRDVIVTSIFGHMNIDHFMFQDVEDLDYDFKIKGIGNRSDPTKPTRFHPKKGHFKIKAKSQYLNELRSGWAALPAPPGESSIAEFGESKDVDFETEEVLDEGKRLQRYLKAIGGPWAERFSLSMVSPSVVPNYFPTLRVLEYNITGLENEHPAEGPVGEPADAEGEDGEVEEAKKKKKKGKNGKKKHKTPKFPVPKPPSKSAPPGPGYSPQPLTLQSFTQYYANLTKIHQLIQADKKSETPEKHFKYKVEYSSNDDKYYQMKDLTVRSMLDLAERIGRDTLKISGTDSAPAGQEPEIEIDKAKDAKKIHKMKNRLWKEFVKRAFVHTKPDEEIEQEFT